jgi:hypothetical protein
MGEAMNRFFYFNYKDSDPEIELDYNAIVGEEKTPCPLDLGHPESGKSRINELVVKLRFPKVRDVMNTWHSDYIITDRVATMFKEKGFTGYELRHVDVRLPQTDRFLGVKPPILWEFRATGWGGIAPESSGIKPVDICSECCYTEYTSLLHPEHLIDESQWDGSDFFFVWPMPGYILITERVKDFVKEKRLKGVDIIPVEKMKLGKDYFCPGKLRYYMDRERAKKLGGHLGID